MMLNLKLKENNNKKLIKTIIVIYIAIIASISVSSLESEEKIDNHKNVISNEEIASFVANSIPAPIPIQLSSITLQERIGSYLYDIQNIRTTFEGFNVLSLNIKSEQSSAGYFPNGKIENIAMPLGIIGSDDRVKITNTTVGPWCNTVKLLIVGANNSNYIGSGFMVGPNSVATAGHCVYNTSWGGWAKAITVIPALNGTNQPYGSAAAYNLECGGNWYNSNDNQDDWGIIRINANLGNSTGWLGLRWQSATYNNLSAKAVGYPGEDGNYMYYGSGVVTSSLPRTLVGNWDLSGGQSGGPVHRYYTTTGYTAIGINRGGGSTYSDCLRIDEWIFNKLVLFRSLSY